MYELSRRNALGVAVAVGVGSLVNTSSAADAPSGRRKFTITYFRMLNMQYRDDEEDLDVSIIVNDQDIVNKQNESHVLNTDYYQGLAREVDPSIRLRVHVKSQDYDRPDYGTYVREHKGAVGEQVIVNLDAISEQPSPPDRGGVWVLKYRID